jgi:hypothetical protein
VENVVSGNASSKRYVLALLHVIEDFERTLSKVFEKL